MFYSEAGPFLNVNPWICADPFSCETAEEQCRVSVSAPAQSCPTKEDSSAASRLEKLPLSHRLLHVSNKPHTQLFSMAIKG